MSQDNTLAWSAGTALQWSDFEAEPHPGLYQDAKAIIRYNCTWNVESHDIDDTLSFSIRNIRLNTLFVKNLSWARINMVDECLLNHMQGCFDLAECLRPDMESALTQKFEYNLYPVRGGTMEEQTQNSMHDSRVVLGALQQIHDTLDAKIAQYQTDTRYGENESGQAVYDQRFSKIK
ncbi:MAG: hypothetical protein F4Y82_04750 [Cenarchaeum sp. SB0665_bin_23]|nr:hypothetical protein [Cenarchaeum sp. SB0665_bin_23]MXZ92996.1 hypothetical protein [Cenarchaeum sp. SB0666_bin_15]MYB47012.1 hypothetical protein [Cenarchaeum sp. SB0662_bin_33]MYC79669.1 hypothetical protein [Cenarchaeum sp. SB0661_bin_35]MYD58718.1 hypothetical protein [Cenarchaeum sp. SB0678_bin_8]MYG32634.1 hypothetical protein [Cenarchaeum sp. SB0677_bin_16]MYJ28223.1 hypothetical protein [Cenarchaeum sp. SB0672_bin_9]